jgi:hypothetical protein
MIEIRNAYTIFTGKPEGKRPLVRPRRRCKDNIRTDLKEIGWEDVDWIHLAQDTERWQAPLNTLMNLRFPQNEYFV